MLKQMLAGATVALGLMAGPALAEWKPDGSVMMMTMFTPGGGDVLSKRLSCLHNTTF
ncbi:MAG: hypothetical protein GKR99_16565 [Rhodobacteraceae bacterium]|nr:hypothetical protein [Paracoccaceae bacterium]